MRHYNSKLFELSLTTQGPTYPPSEVIDEDGNFIVIGRINRDYSGETRSEWGAAIVSASTAIPKFGVQAPYDIVREFSLGDLGELGNAVLHTLPLPLPCNNYPMLFAPEQNPSADKMRRNSYAFHQAPIPDYRYEDGRKTKNPITLGDWVKARGECLISVSNNKQTATFEFDFSGLIPESLYTVMSLREHDLNPDKLSRPGPLGIPNVFITDQFGRASYRAVMPNPFPSVDVPNRNRIINVIVLWMSSQCSYGGAIGLYGLGGDIHAQLKLKEPSFYEFTTVD
ncbi:MAG: hypothetical protein ACYCQI_11625 [Gammaproteobacteria bacterium]